jgi:hypothetical protein
VTRVFAFLLLFCAAPFVHGGDSETFFELNIRPVLAGTCFKCHGDKKTSHGLRVDSREALLRGGDSGPAIVPGDPERSLLMQAIQYAHDDLKMPPDKRLPDRVVADFAAWVKQGAAWPKSVKSIGSAFQEQRHWAFESLRKTYPPSDPSGWAETPIDRYMATKYREHGLKPAREADKRTLIRRLTFDLVGLPPTPEETAAFLADDSSNAWAKLVERLLASPHYGERWGRHWMDVVRYADTAGDNADYPIPEAHRYRDYIIDAFNADKPYDQFVQEQIAGDLLAKQGPGEKYAERLVATGFLALARRYATAPYELWHLTMEDTIETTGRAFLGLTLRCARCHDHKFDPVTQKDYYAIYGIFASTQFPWTGGEEFASMKKPREHLVPLMPMDGTALWRAVQRSIRNKLAAENKRTSEQVSRLADLVGQLATQKQGDASKAQREALTKEFEAIQKQLRAREKALREDPWLLEKSNLPDDLPAAFAVEEGQPGDVHLQVRGEVDQQGPIVQRGVPQFLAGSGPLNIPSGSSGREQLAKWLTDVDNPLTARVMANRIWQHHFGRGIVTTPSNFGIRGEPPTHRELLDWLAGQFIASGWSIKALHRHILLSKTYRLASDNDASNAAKDPGNRWYWRFDRRRLDAEEIRDALLQAAGRLDRSRPGAHPFPPIDQWKWTQHAPFKEVYPTNHRSVYLMTQRFQRHPFLALFDGPDTNTSTEQRTRSTVPQQALFLMNNPWMREQAEGFAHRLIHSAQDPWQRIELAHQLAWSRLARPMELEMGVHYIDAYKKELEKNGVPTGRLEAEAWTSYARILLSANEFVYVD